MDGAAIAFLSWSTPQSLSQPKLATHDELPASEEGKFVVGAHDFHKETGMNIILAGPGGPTSWL